MKLTLKLRYRTRFGQSLWLTGDSPGLGAGGVAGAVPLQYLDSDHWQVVLSEEVASAVAPGSRYWYLLREGDGSFLPDWGADRVFDPVLWGNDALVLDSWNAMGSPHNAFHTAPFKKVLLSGPRSGQPPLSEGRFTHVFRAAAPLLGADQTLALLGGGTALGNWESSHPILLHRAPGEDCLSACADLTEARFPVEYKYGVYDVVRQVFLRYEEGPNRLLFDPAAAGGRVVVNDGVAALPMEFWKGAGVAIPVFSLRSEAGFGIGEFADLESLALWCARVGLKLIQVLPVNDTTATRTWADSYPYCAISAFALHPIYLNLSRAADDSNRALLSELEPERVRLNTLPEVDWEAVLKAKLAFLERIFPRQRETTFQSRDFQAFFAANEHWLRPYAVFCCLRDRFGTADFSRWPAHRRCTPEALAALSVAGAPEHDRVAFHYFVQFLLHVQLRQAVEYAHRQGVVLKGDIAIGVSRHGADTWQEPELYELGMQAGAPPDPFAAKGQNWGFPTYHWPRMQETGFAWWKRRFTQMGAYFDAFRIDHILGFFRIWSIPTEAVEGLLGRFVPAIPVTVEELERSGIAFDRARLVEPFITDSILREFFGGRSEAVKAAFCQAVRPGAYALLPAFSTQRKVEVFFARFDDLAGPESDWLRTPEERDRIKQKLFDLIANVILFEVEEHGSAGYHFRFGMEATALFRGLDERTQGRLRALYHDYFFRRQDAFWRDQAMEKLPALKRVTEMLICGEDLGFVPVCVPGVMAELGLLSLEIQRMPKVFGAAFSDLAKAPYLSVVTPSTHDMTTLRGWWTEDRGVAQRFYHQELVGKGWLPAEGPAVPATCSGRINEAIVRMHLASPAMWSIFQWQDLLGMDEELRRPDPAAERINVPAIPRYHWRYRMHLSLEALIQAQGFNARLKSLVRQYGR